MDWRLALPFRVTDNNPKQAEYTRIPCANYNLIAVPEGVPDEEALYLSDILATSFHQVEDTGVQQGDIVGESFQPCSSAI